MDEFVSKPMRKKVLVEKLAMLLADHPLLAPHAHADRLPVTPAAEVALVDVVPVLDLEVLKCLIEEIDPDGVRAALEVFLRDTPDCLALLRRLSCPPDRTRIKDEAHRLKGAAETFGLCQLCELVEMLELSAITMTQQDYACLVERLEVCFGRSRDEASAALASVLVS